MRPPPFVLIGGLLASPAAAAGAISVTIPQLSVAEYHKPYVAVWLQPADGGAARTLSVWYDVRKTGNEPGTKWLSELRSWWRKGGRSLTIPADGVSGATRAPGVHMIALPTDLKPGAYVLNVEAARETGGRELVSVPMSIPVKAGKAVGKTEIGAIAIVAK
jgi:hypothetical protein